MNPCIGLLGDSSNFSANITVFGGINPVGVQPLTYNDALNSLSSQLLFKIELFAFGVFIYMLLSYRYVEYLENKAKSHDNWIKHIENDLKIKTILPVKDVLSKEDRQIKFIINVLFFPSLFIVLIFIGHVTGWFI